MKKLNQKYTILYARLSQDDGRDGVSNSIENQKMILEKYAQDNGFENCKFIFDDGVSGTHFKRKGWNEVMDLIENNQVNCLIVKDLSRLGRDYLQVGTLLEITLPEHNVRFITTNDGIDTLYGMDDFTPFKAIFAEFYAKDCSRKIRAVKKAQAERGERIATRAPYGYLKCAENPKQIEPDPETQDNIKRIFELCMAGCGPSQIAKQLENEQRINPSNHYYNISGVALGGLDTANPYKWSSSQVAAILENEVYLGHTISMKYTKKSYKNKARIVRPQDEWLRFENTHQALIGQEDWDIAQSVRQTKKRPRKNMDTPSMLSGLVFCGDCGKYLIIHRAYTLDPDKNNYACSTYKRYGKESCSNHYIREKFLLTIILDDLKRVTHFARMKQKEFAEFIAQKSTAETKKQIVNLSKELDVLKKRNQELDEVFKRLYEDSVLNRIPNEVFRKLSADYLAEQKQIQLLLLEKANELERLKGSLSNADKFIAKAEKYAEIEELSPEMLWQFIEKIVVHEKSKKYSKTADNKIEIFYRDIGYLGDYTTETDIVKPHYDFELLPNAELIAVKHEQATA